MLQTCRALARTVRTVGDMQVHVYALSLAAHCHTTAELHNLAAGRLRAARCQHNSGGAHRFGAIARTGEVAEGAAAVRGVTTTTCHGACVSPLARELRSLGGYGCLMLRVVPAGRRRSVAPATLRVPVGVHLLAECLPPGRLMRRTTCTAAKERSGHRGASYLFQYIRFIAYSR